jgi:hypothetical protein
MTEFILWWVGIMLYGVCSGFSWGVLTRNMTDPWKDPGPFFGSLLWPFGLPFTVGFTLVKRGSNRGETRRQRELAEARHQTDLASEKAKQAQRLAEQEQALRWGHDSHL